MTQTELLNKTFMHLYSMRDPYVFPSALNGKIDLAGANPITLLQTIFDIGFADKERNTQQTGSSQSVYNYWINFKGIEFIESLPLEFKELPYTYYKKLEADRELLQEERQRLDDKLKRITLKNIDFNKSLSQWSLIVAIFAILTPIFINTLSGSKSIKTETTIPELKTLHETILQEKKVLQNILDSLRRK